VVVMKFGLVIQHRSLSFGEGGRRVRLQKNQFAN
jgi:hypothetical protein